VSLVCETLILDIDNVDQIESFFVFLLNSRVGMGPYVLCIWEKKLNYPNEITQQSISLDPNMFGILSFLSNLVIACMKKFGINSH
jgi:hypothetical protein